MRSAPRLTSLAALALVAVSCFEPPVAEDLRLEFTADGLVTVTARTRIREHEDKNPALQRRIEQARREALEGTDAWGRRFEALAPPIERAEWEKHEGRLVNYSRSATTDDPEALSRFFADTGVAVEWRIAEERAELALYPPAAGGATRAERQAVARALDDWSAAVADYLAAAEPLWRHLDDHPGRATAIFARLFSSYLPDEEVERTGPLSGEEKRRVEALREAIDRVTAVLSVPEGEAYSVDELSRRVYDPLPAPLAVRVPGTILELEGFTATGQGAGELHAGGTSLWEALRGVEGRWLAPDPAVALVAHDLERVAGQPFPLAEFAGRQRRIEPPPSQRETQDALVEQLQAAPAYRIVWAQPSVPGEEPAKP